MVKTIAEINEKIRKKEAVVVTADEMCRIVDDRGAEKAAKEVDVVTTGTFGPMCSSGAFLNVKQSKPKIKMGGGTTLLNDVQTYAGTAAADIYIGATAMQANDPLNSVFPGEFNYGGGHVIQDLVAGKSVRLEATAYGTDCYPRKSLEMSLTMDQLNNATLWNPRNAYQNYNCAVNLSKHTIYTYMGVLKPNMRNGYYCSAGQLSPLLNDPYYQTIGIGTRIFLGGGVGYISWNGTQHNPAAPRSENGVPTAPAGTLAVTGDLKQMSPDWLVGVSFPGYGTSLAIGLGIPIPILDEEMAARTAVKDEDIITSVVDYSEAYPKGEAGTMGTVTYADLKSGTISVDGREVPVAPLSSYSKAVQVSQILKKSIEAAEFFLTEPVQALPSERPPKFVSNASKILLNETEGPHDF